MTLVLTVPGLALAAETPRPFYGVVTFECGPLVGGSVTILDTANGQSLSATTASDGSWSVDLPDSFATGHSVTVTATSGGASGSASATVAGGIQRAPDILFQAPPLLSISRPAYGSTTAAASVEVAGTADGTGSAPQLYINGAQVPVAADNSFQTSVGLTVGENWLNATLLDCLGNTVSQSILVHMSAPAPVVPGGGGPPPSSPTPPPAAAPPRVAILNMSVEPGTVLLGKSAVVTVTVRNDGGAGEADLTLSVNGTPAGTQKVVLGAGETRSVPFFLALSKVGAYNLSAGSATGTLTVLQALPQRSIAPSGTTPAPSPAAAPGANATLTPAPAQVRPTPRPTPGMEAGLAAAALGLAAVAATLRRRRP